jgi:hypothetical protein
MTGSSAGYTSPSYGPHTVLGSAVEEKDGAWVLVPVPIPGNPAIVADLS